MAAAQKVGTRIADQRVVAITSIGVLDLCSGGDRQGSTCQNAVGARSQVDRRIAADGRGIDRIGTASINQRPAFRFRECGIRVGIDIVVVIGSGVSVQPQAPFNQPAGGAGRMVDHIQTPSSDAGLAPVMAGRQGEADIVIAAARWRSRCHAGPINENRPCPVGRDQGDGQIADVAVPNVGHHFHPIQLDRIDDGQLARDASPVVVGDR